MIEFPVLIAIDDYNELYNYSQTWRNPETARFKPEKIQNRHLTLTCVLPSLIRASSLFRKVFLDAHRDPQLINGTFVGAVSLELAQRHFNVEAERGDNSDWIEVQPYTVEELNRVMEHYKRTKTIFARASFYLVPSLAHRPAATSTGTHEVLHQLTSGNGYELNKWSVGI